MSLRFTFLKLVTRQPSDNWMLRFQLGTVSIGYCAQGARGAAGSTGRQEGREK